MNTPTCEDVRAAAVMLDDAVWFLERFPGFHAGYVLDRLAFHRESTPVRLRLIDDVIATVNATEADWGRNGHDLVAAAAVVLTTRATGQIVEEDARVDA